MLCYCCDICNWRMLPDIQYQGIFPGVGMATSFANKLQRNCNWAPFSCSLCKSCCGNWLVAQHFHCVNHTDHYFGKLRLNFGFAASFQSALNYLRRTEEAVPLATDHFGRLLIGIWSVDWRAVWTDTYCSWLLIALCFFTSGK